MTNYASWRPIYRAMCPDPGPRDLFAVILIDGKRAGLQNIGDFDEYEKLSLAAARLAEQHKCQVKVLPMNGGELLNFFGIQPAAPQPIENMDPAFRAQAVQNCMDTIRECQDSRQRQEAMDLLRTLGVMQ